MIRTLIEVVGDDEWKHKRELEKALDQLGFKPKDDPDHIRWMDALFQELRDRDLDPMKLVEAQRAKRGAL